MATKTATAKKRVSERRKNERRWFWEIFTSKIAGDRRATERRDKKNRRKK